MAVYASDIMTPNVVGVPAHTICINAVNKMADMNVGSVLILDNQKLLGIFTERDLLSHISSNSNPNFLFAQISEVMTKNPATVLPTDNIQIVEKLFFEFGFRHCPVVDESQNILGLISQKDLFNARLNELSGAISSHVKDLEIMKKDLNERKAILLFGNNIEILDQLAQFFRCNKFEVAIQQGDLNLEMFKDFNKFTAIIYCPDINSSNEIELTDRVKEDVVCFMKSPFLIAMPTYNSKWRLNYEQQGLGTPFLISEIFQNWHIILNFKISEYCVSKIGEAQREIELFRSIVVTYNHEIKNILAAMLGQIDIQSKKFHDQGIHPDFNKIRNSGLKIKQVLDKINRVKEVNETIYSGKSKMIEL